MYRYGDHEDSTLRGPLYEWNAEFQDRRAQCYPAHNLRFWEIWEKRQQQTGLQTIKTASEILEAFVGNFRGRSSLSSLHQAAVIRGFCKLADLDLLESGTAADVSKPIALLDDRNEAGPLLDKDQKGTQRPYKGPLSSHGLWKELSRKRYGKTLSTQHLGNHNFSSSTQHEARQSSPDETDADRRLIYVVDLDCWSLLAIVSTAPPLQAQDLRPFIYKYLSSQAFIGVNIPVTGFQSFALEFHLPIFAWRKCKTGQGPVKDSRCLTDDRPLRRSQDLSFLSMLVTGDPDGSEDCIYEVQISCLVSGVDLRSWVAYLCADTYYKGEDNDESPLAYDKEAKVSKIFMDPLTNGQYDANRQPTWGPREYFIQVLETRLDQVKQEWANVVGRVLQVIDPYTHDDPRLDFAELRRKDVQRHFNKTIQLLDRMSHLLTKIIVAWDTFREIDFDYISDMEKPKDRNQPSPQRILKACGKHISELDYLRKSVVEEKELLQRFSEQVSFNSRALRCGRLHKWHGK